MNKIFTTLTIVFLCATISFAQEDVYKTIAKETCDCLAKKNMDYNTVSKAEIQMSLGLCMMESAERNKLAMDLTDLQAMTELGQKVGMQVAPLCPEVFKVFAKEEEALEEIVEEEEDDTEYFTASGKITAVEVKDFVYVTLKETSGTTHKLIWIYSFPGSDDFKSDPKKLTGKNATFTYVILEAFQPKTKTYGDLKIISGLEIK